MNQDIRELFAAHAASDEEHFKQIGKEMQELKDLIKPMAENYIAASKLGKWMMAILVFVSVIVGIILSVKSGLR